jgi:hypothetical protein
VEAGPPTDPIRPAEKGGEAGQGGPRIREHPAHHGNHVVGQQGVGVQHADGGFGNLLMFGQGGFLDHKDTVANITLFAKEVLPRLRELNRLPQKAVAAE